jgi:hypothetical protein
VCVEMELAARPSACGVSLLLLQHPCKLEAGALPGCQEASGPPPSPAPASRDSSLSLSMGWGGGRVVVLLILLIRPSLLSTRHGQHLNACTRGEAGRKTLVGMDRKRKNGSVLGIPDLLSPL